MLPAVRTTYALRYALAAGRQPASRRARASPRFQVFSTDSITFGNAGRPARTIGVVIRLRRTRRGLDVRFQYAFTRAEPAGAVFQPLWLRRFVMSDPDFVGQRGRIVAIAGDPSLRGAQRRRNLQSHGDCFASFAMTKRAGRPAERVVTARHNPGRYLGALRIAGDPARSNRAEVPRCGSGSVGEGVAGSRSSHMRSRAKRAASRFSRREKVAAEGRRMRDEPRTRHAPSVPEPATATVARRGAPLPARSSSRSRARRNPSPISAGRR